MKKLFKEVMKYNMLHLLIAVALTSLAFFGTGMKRTEINYWFLGFGILESIIGGLSSWLLMGNYDDRFKDIFGY